MRELDEALAGISEIRRQLAQSIEFRGYGPATVAVTGLLAFAAAWVQSVWLPDPAGDLSAYLALWIATACSAVGLVGAEMLVRSRRLHASLAAEMAGGAAEQFIPAGVAAPF